MKEQEFRVSNLWRSPAEKEQDAKEGVNFFLVTAKRKLWFASYKDITTGKVVKIKGERVKSFNALQVEVEQGVFPFDYSSFALSQAGNLIPVGERTGGEFALAWTSSSD